jgi:hypothetical protein
MTLEYITSELENRHPATSRYMDNTDDLDMAPRDTLGPNSPSGISPVASRHALLRKEVD